MSGSLALEVFERLVQQVDQVEAIARGTEPNDPQASVVLRRSAFVLAVAAIDTFFHEKAVVRLLQSVHTDPSTATRVCNYLKGVKVADVSGPDAEGHARLSLSLKTLVAPEKIDSAITAWGDDPAQIWQTYCVREVSREDRVRRQLSLIYDRRNQIAHEGDWDVTELDFRVMSQQNLEECTTFARRLARGFDRLI